MNVKSKCFLISSIVQLFFGVLAVISFIILFINGEDMSKWIITLLLALVFMILGIIGIVLQNKSKLKLRNNSLILESFTTLLSCFFGFSPSTGLNFPGRQGIFLSIFKSVFYTCISLFDFISNFIPSYIKFILAFMSLSITESHSVQWYSLLLKSFILLSLFPQ